LLGELKSIFVPILFEGMSDLTFSRMAGSARSYDFVFTDMRLKSTGLVPDNVNLEWVSNFNLGLKKKTRKGAFNPDSFKQRIVLDVSNICFHIEDCKFWYRHRTTPKWEDQGLMNASGNNVRFRAVFQQEISNERLGGNQNNSTFSLQSVNVQIGSLSIKMRDSKHDILYSVITSLFSPFIKSRLEGAIEDKLKEGGNTAAERLNKLWVQIINQGKSMGSKVTEKVKQTGPAIKQKVKNEAKKKAQNVKKTAQEGTSTTSTTTTTTTPLPSFTSGVTPTPTPTITTGTEETPSKRVSFLPSKEAPREHSTPFVPAWEGQQYSKDYLRAQQQEPSQSWSPSTRQTSNPFVPAWEGQKHSKEYLMKHPGSCSPNVNERPWMESPSHQRIHGH